MSWIDKAREQTTRQAVVPESSDTLRLESCQKKQPNLIASSDSKFQSDRNSSLSAEVFFPYLGSVFECFYFH